MISGGNLTEVFMERSNNIGGFRSVEKCRNGVAGRMCRLKNHIIIVISILVIVVFLSTRQKNKEDIYVIAKKSYFETFEIIDKKVYIYTTIVFQNNSNETKEITVTGKFNEDQKAGLLEEEILDGYDKKTSEKSFFVEANTSKTYSIVFEGTWGGGNQKNDRNLPEIQMDIL